MYIVLISLIILLAVLLVLVVLAQNSKGGLSSQFGGSGASQVIGVKKASDLLEKLTWGFAIGIMVLALVANVLLKGDEPTNFEAPNIEKSASVGNTLQDLGVSTDEDLEELTEEQNTAPEE